MLKRRRSTVKSLPQDVIELILERLPVKLLLKFKSVSKMWKSSIESTSFKERQFIHRKQSRGPDILYMTWEYIEVVEKVKRKSCNVLGSSMIRTVKFPTLEKIVCHGSCDGLVCLFGIHFPSIVVNPAAGWNQSFPLSNVQQLLSVIYKSDVVSTPHPQLGFGKDKFNGTYKPVWLVNSYEFGLSWTTTCEVFDFSINAWRYVFPASPYRILDQQKPVYFDGSLYWLTECEETKVLSFDLHTETFQVICKLPFTSMPFLNRYFMCILDNRLCVSQTNWPTQVIWLFDSSGTWKKFCSIDLIKTITVSGHPYFQSREALPIAILEKKKLLLGRESHEPVFIHDCHTKSYDLVYIPEVQGFPVCYYESLFTASSN